MPFPCKFSCAVMRLYEFAFRFSFAASGTVRLQVWNE